MYENTHSKNTMLASPAEQEPEHIPVFEGALGSWHLSIERTPFRAGELATRYDGASASWNRTLNRLGFLQAYRALMRRLLDDGPLSALPDGAWVLDAGTGTGALSRALASQYKTEETPLMFSAIDQSPRMLQAARSAFEAARLNVDLKLGDVCRLPYETGTFDLGMAAHVVEHLPTPETALRELVRVLRPGAPLLLLVTRRSLLGALVHLRWRVHRFGKPALTAQLRRCGVADLRFIELPGPPWCRHMSLACVGCKKP